MIASAFPFLLWMGLLRWQYAPAMIHTCAASAARLLRSNWRKIDERRNGKRWKWAIRSSRWRDDNIVNGSNYLTIYGLCSNVTLNAATAARSAKSLRQISDFVRLTPSMIDESGFRRIYNKIRILWLLAFLTHRFYTPEAMTAIHLIVMMMLVFLEIQFNSTQNFRENISDFVDL